MKLFSPRSYRVGMSLSFAFTVFSKGVGYIRQLLVAFYFGVSRTLDIYFMAYGITMWLVFAYTTWFDQIAIPRLVRRQEEAGEEGFRDLAGSLMMLSVLIGVVMLLAFLALLKPASWLLCHGFTTIEQQRVRHLALFFMPWILIIFPYSALVAIIKSQRYYDAALTADLVVSCIATGGFALWHEHLVSLPLMLALGYAVAALGLIVHARRYVPLAGSLWTPAIKGVYRNFAELFMVNQMNVLQSGIDRFFQSYLQPGVISAYGYAAQTLSPLYELLSFDELFIVPLSSTEQRLPKLQRLLSGILLLTIPIVAFLIGYAPILIEILYQRGRFDASARTLTTTLFRVAALAVISGAISTPLGRMLQIYDRVLSTGWINFSSSVLILILNTVLIFKFKATVLATTISTVAASVLYVMVELILLARIGVRLELLRLLKYPAYAVLVAALALWLSRHLPVPGAPFLEAAVRGSVYLLVVSVLYWPIRSNIRFIVYGA